MHSVTFIVFTYNSSDIISKTLQHIEIALLYHPIEHEVIIVDNNSSDNTLRVVREIGESLSINLVVVNNPIQGLAYSRRYGVGLATKSYVCFIDDDNWIHEDWCQVLDTIVSKYNPDIIGGSAVGVSSVDFPVWWGRYKAMYACGDRFDFDGFVEHPFDKIWGAGMIARTSLLKKALLKRDLFCKGRTGTKQLSGEDTELVYRMRYLGANLFYSRDLKLDHYMRPSRLDKAKLKDMRKGNAEGAVYIDIYKYLLVLKFWNRLFFRSCLLLLICVPLSIKYRLNYFPYILERFKTLNSRRKLQLEIKSILDE